MASAAFAAVKPSSPPTHRPAAHHLDHGAAERGQAAATTATTHHHERSAAASALGTRLSSTLSDRFKPTRAEPMHVLVRRKPFPVG
jgi:hypothetical protein